MLKSNMRTTLAVLHDAAAAALAWSLAYLLRFNFDLPAGFAAELRQTLFWIVPLQMLIFWRFGLYRGIWRYASTADLRRIVLAVALSAAAIPLRFWMLRPGPLALERRPGRVGQERRKHQQRKPQRPIPGLPARHAEYGGEKTQRDRTGVAHEHPGRMKVIKQKPQCRRRYRKIQQRKHLISA